MEEIRAVTVPVRYAPLAIAHLNAIHAYIAERSPAAAQDVMARIRRSIGFLQDFSEAGRPGARRETREHKVPNLPYIIVHRLDRREEALVILGVYHTARKRPGR